MKNDLDLMLLSQLTQRETTELLKRHRRNVAANTVLPSASPEQRDVALRERSDEELLARAKRASQATVGRYESRAAAAFAEAMAAGLSVWTLVEERSGNIDSWYTFKAGVQRFLENEVVRAKGLLDKWQREWRLSGPSPQLRSAGTKLVARLNALAGLLQEVPTGAPERFKGDGKSKRYSKNSKSRSIRTAADDWREQAAETMTGDLKLLFLLQCVTGCRPQELANGVQVRLLRDGTMVTRVKGAKTDDIAGQPSRSMRLSVSAGIALVLASKLQTGRTLNSRHFDLGLVNTYGRKVARACARVFPKRTGSAKLSAYSARHQLKADLMAVGWNAEDIAMAMGHATTRTGTAYGRGGRGGGGGVRPIAIKAPRAVKLRGKHPNAKSSAAATKVAASGQRRPRPKP